MHRIDTSTAQKDKFGSGKNGFTGGNPQTGELPTALDADFFDSVQEEIASVIEAAGLSLAKANNAQLLAAMKALVGPGRLLNVQVFTVSGSYTPTAGTKKIIVEVQAGGGAGGGTPATSSSQNSVASGGSSGQYVKSQLQVSSLSLPVTVTVGVGGSGVAGANGSGGGASTFGSVLSATGGLGGGAGTASTSAYVIQPAAARSLPTVGNIENAGGSPGGPGILTQIGAGVSGHGGSSRFAGGGNPGSVSGGGYTQAVGYGSGGAGSAVASSTAAQQGGSGGTGILIVWEYA